MRKLRVIVQLEGTARLLDTEFNLAELLEPYAKRIVRERLSPKMVIRRFAHSLRDWDRFLTALPNDLGEVLRLARQGQVRVHIEHERVEPIVNRTIYGLQVAALLLASALLLSFDVPPTADGLSILGIAGLGIAVVMGLNLLRRIKRSGGM